MSLLFFDEAGGFGEAFLLLLSSCEGGSEGVREGSKEGKEMAIFI